MSPNRPYELMRIPSTGHILDQTIAVIRRHPLELLAAGVGTYAAAQLTFDNPDYFKNLLVRILLTAALALPSFLALTLRERFRNLSKAQRLAEYAVGAAILLFFFFSMEEEPRIKDFIRFGVLNLSAHLLVSSAGFIGRGSTHSFWQFNRHLFLRIITAGIFSVVLFAGLAGSLAAIQALFDFKIEDEVFGRLFIWIMGVFNTAFFLAGVPRTTAELESQTGYPRVLKIFTQYVLVPLVFIYMVILLAYEAKIIVNAQLPNGWVSNLVIAFAIVGILSILLVYPIRGMEGNRWIKLFSKWFYLLLLPLLALMFVAIIVRIRSYGFTEERVFVLATAIWLAFISIYFLVRPGGDIRVIPISLAIVALVLSAGPLSAFEISRLSQRARLESLLTKNDMLEKGVTVKPKGEVSFAERKAISSTTAYLIRLHGVKSLYPYFNAGGLADSKPWQSAESAEFLMSSLGLDYVHEYETEQTPSQDSWYSFEAPGVTVPIEDYDEYLYLSGDIGRNLDSGLHIRKAGSDGFAVYRGREALSASINPLTTLKLLKDKYPRNVSASLMNPEDMQVMVSGKGCKILIIYHSITGYTDGRDSRSYEGTVFIKWE